MSLEGKAALGRGWACFWAAVDEQTADQVGEELASGRRRDAMNLLWALSREFVRYPTAAASHDAESSSLPSSAFTVNGSRLSGHVAAGVDA